MGIFDKFLKVIGFEDENEIVLPNTKIIQAYEMGGGNGMEEQTGVNLWDSIQVDMTAEFDKVKVTLGELKSIEEGLIVDLCSVYDNKVSLKVGGKMIALGELVIVNDRFGVRIEKVNEPQSSSQPVSQEQIQEEKEEEEFDYSDFEVDGEEV